MAKIKISNLLDKLDEVLDVVAELKNGENVSRETSEVEEKEAENVDYKAKYLEAQKELDKLTNQLTTKKSDKKSDNDVDKKKIENAIKRINTLRG